MFGLFRQLLGPAHDVFVRPLLFSAVVHHLRRTLPVMTERPTTLCEAFQRTAAIDPDAVALRTPGDAQTLTWRDYADQVRRVAAGLAALGVQRGDTVSLMMANRVEFYPLDVGAQHLGATSFSVYNTLAPEQLTYLFDNAGTKVVICEEQYVDRMRASGATIEHIVCIDGSPDGTISLDDMLAGGRGRFRLRIRLARSATRRRHHADLHVGHDRKPQGRGDDAREPAVRGVRSRRGARRRVR